MANKVLRARANLIFYTALSGLMAWIGFDMSRYLAVWKRCAGCGDSLSDWNAVCGVLMIGGVLAGTRAVVAFGQVTLWWLRHARWKHLGAPLRDGIDQSSLIHVVWDDPEMGYARAWGKLSSCEAFERIELLCWAGFAIFVVLTLWGCELCPRWAGDSQASCQRFLAAAAAPAVAIASFGLLRAFFAVTQAETSRPDLGDP